MFLRRATKKQMAFVPAQVGWDFYRGRSVNRGLITGEKCCVHQPASWRPGCWWQRCRCWCPWLWGRPAGLTALPEHTDWLPLSVPPPTIRLHYVCVCVSVCRHRVSVGLTSGGDHADDYGWRGGRALDQQRDQDANDHTSQRVGQDGVVLKDVACCFACTHTHGRPHICLNFCN